jgi:hypothetical protein
MVDDDFAIAYGELPLAVSVPKLRAVLRSCGLTPSEGDTHHVSVRECSHFVFREDGKGAFILSADAETLMELERDAALVSTALTAGGIAHRFELHAADDTFYKALSHGKW